MTCILRGVLSAAGALLPLLSSLSFLLLLMLLLLSLLLISMTTIIVVFLVGISMIIASILYIGQLGLLYFRVPVRSTIRPS